MSLILILCQWIFMYASETFEFHSVKAADLLIDQNVRVIARNSGQCVCEQTNKQTKAQVVLF